MEITKTIGIDNSKFSIPIIQVNINYLEHVVGRLNTQSDYHSHTDWQAEFIIDGDILCHFKDKDIGINSTKILIIPPGIYHSFKYNKFDNDYYSVKFSCDLTVIKAPLLLDDKEVVCPLCHYLQNILSTNTDNQLIAIHMQNLLKNLLELELVKGRSLYRKNIAEQVSDMIKKNSNTSFTAEDIAQKMNISRDYLSKKIKEETGISLKPFMDLQKVEIAKTLLQLSELSISEIAFQLHFVDVFSFSRFFKRISCLSPSQYRKKYQNEEKNQNIIQSP